MKFYRSLCRVAGVVLGLSSLSAAAAPVLVFDSLSGAEQFSSRNVGDSPGSEVQVTTAVVLSNIAVKNQLSTAGDLKFLIFDDTTNALLFQTTSQAYTDTTSSWKLSPDFTFTLLPGTYDIGAIADVAGLWSYDRAVESENGITSVVNNPNFANYDTPVSTGHAGGDAAIQLYTAPAATGVPLPVGAYGAILGLAVAVGLRRRGMLVA